jgi:hypothetical protein
MLNKIECEIKIEQSETKTSVPIQTKDCHEAHLTIGLKAVLSGGTKEEFKRLKEKQADSDKSAYSTMIKPPRGIEILPVKMVICIAMLFASDLFDRKGMSK